MRFSQARCPAHGLVVPLFLAMLSGQVAAAESDTGLWTTATMGRDFNERWSGALALQSRAVNDSDTLERVVLRPMLNLRLRQQLTLTAGYDAHFIRAPRDLTEQRLWQQGSWRAAAGRFRFLTRVRLEQRFIEEVGGTAVRLRVLQRLQTAPGRNGWYLAASNEVFLGLNNLAGIPAGGFDQNRFYAAVGRSWPAVTAEVGYQMQYLDRRPQDRMIHQLMLSLRL